MSIKKEEIINFVSNLSVLELNDLIKSFEKKFNISVNEISNSLTKNVTSENLIKKEQTEFSVILTEIGGSKISLIKMVKEITNLGLKQSKDLVDSLPKILKEGISKLDADLIIKKIESVGAKANIK